MSEKHEKNFREYFFFQAEDGIRILYVTGVQTCALPISGSPASEPAARRSPAASRPLGSGCGPRSARTRATRTVQRSEERRVGKESRPELMRSCMEKEIQDIEQRLHNYQTMAQQMLQRKW